jgi:arylformamidase
MNPSPERRLFDVSRPLSAGTPNWPGDVPFALRTSCRIRDGASVNLSAVETSLHSATHCDAPFHYDDDGVTIERVSVEAFIGPAWVVDVRGTPGCWRSRLEGLDFAGTPRVLFRTGGWPDSARFPERLPLMEPELPAWLGGRGVILIGLDVPSVDAIDSKTLPTHRALGRRGILILEGLWLDDVPEGRYELIAPPLKVVGGDGTPLRAVLRTLPSGR